MEQIELFSNVLPTVRKRIAATGYWVIVDDTGNIIHETNRKVPRIFATRQRADEKIQRSYQVGKWQAKLAELKVQ